MLLSLQPWVVEVITFFFPLLIHQYFKFFFFSATWEWSVSSFGSGLWIMDFYWIVGLDIPSSFQLSRHLHRSGLNIFILSFELNNHSSCINLVSKKVLKTSFWHEFAVFQGQGSVSFSELGYWTGFPLVHESHQESRSGKCSSAVMPCWHSWGCAPVLGQGVPCFPHLLQARGAAAGRSWNQQLFCFHVREKFKSQTIPHQKEMLSLPSVPARHVFDLL